MLLSRRGLVALTTGGWAAAAAITACSGAGTEIDSPAVVDGAAGGEDGASAGGDAGAGDGGGSSDGASGGEASADAGDGGCPTLANDAPVVVSTCSAGLLVAMRGGALVAGKYHLTSVREHRPNELSCLNDFEPMALSQTLVLDVGMDGVGIATIAAQDGADAGAPTVRTVTLAPGPDGGSPLALGPVCPAGAPAPVQYASGSPPGAPTTVRLSLRLPYQNGTAFYTFTKL